MDKACYDALKELQHDNKSITNTLRNCVELYLLDDLEAADPLLEKAKGNPPSLYGTQYENYCWCLTPYFTNFILKIIPQDEYLTYVDSDIFFYHSPKTILDVIGSKSVGIHTHRFSGLYDDKLTTGWFNVGVVVFKNNSIGVGVSNFWKDAMLNTGNIYYKDYGTCGDQKYLNLFIPLWGKDNVCVFDEDSTTIRCGHLAPWNCSHLKHPARHIIINKHGHHEQVIFFHFSHFTLDETGNQWSDSINGEWKPADDPNIRKYYEDYFQTIQHIKDYL